MAERPQQSASAPPAWVASAPGKMMLSGEYAVLEDAPALVAAVERRAFIRWVDMSCVDMRDREPARGAPAGASSIPLARSIDSDSPMFPEVAATRHFVEDTYGVHPDSRHLELTADVTALRGERVKLGLGSSSACAAATAALVLAAVDSERSLERDRLLAAALHGHAVVAPNGSGADVAACVYGGYCLYRRASAKAQPVTWPPGLCVSVVFTGHAASTRELVGRVHGLRQRNPAAYRSAMDRLGSTSGELASAFIRSDVAAIVELAGQYGAAMGDLGQAAGAPIVDERLELLARFAEKAGGACKPSGAGGGDVAIGFFRDADRAHAFERLCAARNFEVLDIPLGAPGARLEVDPA